MIVFCTTCKNRTEHLRKTLPQNMADNPDAKFVVLDYNSQDDLLDFLFTICLADIKSGRLVVYSYKDDVPFKMAHAKNIAHRCGILEGGTILVNVDADNFVGKDFDKFITKQFQREKVFLWAGVIKGKGKRFRGCSGRIAVTKDAFILSGGYNEKYATWAPDDKEFNARLKRMGYEPIEIDKDFLHAIPHSDGVRFKEYPHVQVSEVEEELALSDNTTTIVNYGKFGEGTVYKNRCENSITLLPIPTRIFGIGMHKTATNSLNKALLFLGINSANWRSPRQARQIWKEMQFQGVSPAIEEHAALCDLPITVLYKKLDKAYPNSKFILTVRNEYKWLESVRKHWTPEHNPFRASWDEDCFTHWIHEVVYGQREFNSELFLSVYRRHNAEVKEYFKNRPNDLLIMDMDAGAGWKELCNFLGITVPKESYPIEFVTK